MRTTKRAVLVILCLAVGVLATTACEPTVGTGTARVQVLRDGAPVSKARLVFHHETYADRSITTGTDGVATVALPAGRWYVEVEAIVQHADDPWCFDVSYGDLEFSVATGQTRRLVVDLEMEEECY
jgi:hypothetical protein